MNLITMIKTWFFMLMPSVTDGDGGDGGGGTGAEGAGGDAGTEGGEGVEGTDGGGDDPTSKGDGGDKSTSGEEGDGGEPTPDDAVPEGDYNFVMPEGMSLDAEAAGVFSPLMKEANLTQGMAQKFATAQAELVKNREAAAVQAYKDQVTGWENDTKADKELGGDNLANTKEMSALALKEVGSPELSEFLDQYGIGNHPALVKMLVKVGAMVKEDGPGPSGTPTGGEKSRSEIMYPTK